ALALRRGLDAASAAIAGGERNAARVEGRGRQAMEALGVEPEYFAVVSAATLAPVRSLSGEILLAVAARVGGVRLIDNEIVGAPPYQSYESSNARAVATAHRFADAGCDAVKMEGAGATVDRARAVIAVGIPVMGHVGLTPQQTGDPEGFRVHGKTADAALEI